MKKPIKWSDLKGCAGLVRGKIEFFKATHRGQQTYRATIVAVEWTSGIPVPGLCLEDFQLKVTSEPDRWESVEDQGDINLRTYDWKKISAPYEEDGSISFSVSDSRGLLQVTIHPIPQKRKAKRKIKWLPSRLSAKDPDGIIARAAFLSKPDKPRDTSIYQ